MPKVKIPQQTTPSPKYHTLTLHRSKTDGPPACRDVKKIMIDDKFEIHPTSFSHEISGDPPGFDVVTLKFFGKVKIIETKPEPKPEPKPPEGDPKCPTNQTSQPYQKHPSNN